MQLFINPGPLLEALFSMAFSNIFFKKSLLACITSATAGSAANEVGVLSFPLPFSAVGRGGVKG